MNVTIGIPTAGSPTEPFLASLGALLPPAQGQAMPRIVVTGNFVPGQREMIVGRALQSECDVLVMIDDDITLPPDALVRLVDALESEPELGAVGVLYYSRDGKRPMVVSRWQGDDTTGAVVPALVQDGLTMVDGVGFGCVALRMSALASFTTPIFATQIAFDEAALNVRLCNEDYLLCERLRKAGWKIAVDARIRAGHFDRATKITFPIAWEPRTVTQYDRMYVRDSGGVQRLIPADHSLPRAEERHLRADLDYIHVV